MFGSLFSCCGGSRNSEEEPPLFVEEESQDHSETLNHPITQTSCIEDIPSKDDPRPERSHSSDHHVPIDHPSEEDKTPTPHFIPTSSEIHSSHTALPPIGGHSHPAPPPDDFDDGDIYLDDDEDIQELALGGGVHIPGAF
eukprot:gnl/Dysnectes_brevis/2184_a2544_2249.p1 GENE.gnl/Dysnectes_brevis/2184_a2544_2249~~gnl/Dysnectes_brevis/2184_a2544_2249.p1  ORF type:complete len:140 (+),score=29.19 gnl/Dysnectes_brevis/2184_a2544_2249:50-469(+)